MAVEAEPLARLETDGPHPDLVGLGDELAADTAIGRAGLRSTRRAALPAIRSGPFAPACLSIMVRAMVFLRSCPRGCQLSLPSG